MRHVRLFRYQIPFQSAQIFRGKPLEARTGLIFCLTENDKTGWGEVAPLPYFSQESLAQAEAELKGWLRLWQQGQNPMEASLPSVAFGTSAALWELQGKLKKSADFHRLPAPSVPLILGTSVPQGVKLAKVKLALDRPEAEGERLNQLFAENPELRLRLDANRQWSLAEAVKFGKKMADFHRLNIAFFEEPCRSPAESLAFAEQTGIAIAWDETTREADFALSPQAGVAAVVLKPSLLGSLEKCQGWIEIAHQMGLTAVISSSIESSLGLSQLARFARQFTPDTPAGLDTLRLLTAQLQRPFGEVDLPLIHPQAPCSPWLAQIEL